MAFRAPPSFCADIAIEKFLPLKGFTPAKSFCSNLAVHQRSIEVANHLYPSHSAAIAGIPPTQRDIQCSAGSTLCSLLTELQAADQTIARNVCRCIGVYILVPGITSSEQPTTESTSNPTFKHQTEPTLIDKPTMNSLPTITSEIEIAETASIASDITTTISEWSNSTPTFASLPNAALTSDTISGASDVSIKAYSSTSSSTLSSPSLSSCVSTGSVSLSGNCPFSGSSHTSSSSSSSFSSSFSSLPTSALASDTMSGASDISIETSSSSSSSSSSLPGTSSCIPTHSIFSGYNCPFSSSSHSSSSSGSSLSGSSSCSSTNSHRNSRTSLTSSSTTSSAIASVCSPTCTYPTATTPCPTVTATGLAYKQYYAGQCFVENTANPGTSGAQPAIYTRFRGVYDVCAVTQYCANSAAAAYGQYYSFDLHYTCSNSSWMCVQYYYRNGDASYFDVENMDVAVAVGYSY